MVSYKAAITDRRAKVCTCQPSGSTRCAAHSSALLAATGSLSPAVSRLTRTPRTPASCMSAKAASSVVLVDHRDAARLRAQYAQRIDRHRIIGAIRRRMHDHHALDPQRAMQRGEFVNRRFARRIGAARPKREARVRPEHMHMTIAGIARHVEIRRRMRDAQNFRHSLISRTCFAFSVAADSRNWKSVPVDTMRAPILTNSAASAGWLASPPTPTCLPCLAQASMVRA